MVKELHQDAINAIVYGDHGAPFDVLGPHDADKGKVVVRVFRPTAKTLTLIAGANNTRYEMDRLRNEGLFEVVVTGRVDKLKYTCEAVTYEGQVERFSDPYAFPAWLTDQDLYLFGEGKYLNSYDKLGGHVREVAGVSGVNFAVWAPNAQRVSVVGDFNRWDARIHPMRMHPNGIWELFVPDIQAGVHYKYDIRSHHRGYRAEKIDPYGFYFEKRPKTASIVHDVDQYSWGDEAWMTARRDKDYLGEPMSIYEVHLGSWRRTGEHGEEWLTYREMADTLVPYVKEMNYTHVELMPVAEHPFDGSWGYQVTGYYAPTSRFGTPDDFMYLVDQFHQHDIGVIVDWVPAHFPKDGHALSYFDGTHLYSHEDSRLGEHPDWGTYIFNYGRNEVRNFLLSNALFWLKYYHIDGLRVDAVSSMLYLNFGREDGQWIPNMFGGNENLEAVSFLKEFNEIVHAECPGAVTIAEESTAWAMVSRPTYIGGLGFTLKWNMGWMHDTLKYMKKEPIHRRFHHNEMTFSMMYAYTENFVLSLSHDEVVHLKGSLIEKMPGDWWQKFANLRLLHGYQVCHPGKQLSFMGQEFGQWQEWSEARSLDWHLLDLPTHQGVQRWVQDLNRFYGEQPALFQHDFDPQGHQWIEPNDADNSIFVFMRFADNPADFVVVACNFTPVPRENYRIGVPKPGYYRELLNSDSEFYGGSNVGNNGGVEADHMGFRDWPYSMSITLPPLAIVVFKL